MRHIRAENNLCLPDELDDLRQQHVLRLSAKVEIALFQILSR
jgi:hypothetical protein